MRRTPLTVLLIGTSLAAAAVVPRLLQPPPAIPPATPMATAPQATPARVIPELAEPVVDLAEPEVDPTFWDDCPACGMG